MSTGKSTVTSLDKNSIDHIITDVHKDPFQLLGPHATTPVAGRQRVVIRAFLPEAEKAWIANEDGNVLQAMRRVHDHGLYEAVCDEEVFGASQGKYQFRVAQGDETVMVNDPYAFEPLMTDLDLHLLGEGNHDDIYEILGAHPRTIGDVVGVNFAVWAPNAKACLLYTSPSPRDRG